MNRQPGYYWVKYRGEWEIAKWYEYMTGKFEWDFFGLQYEDDYFEEIDERRIERPNDSKETPHWKQAADAIHSVFGKKK